MPAPSGARDARSIALAGLALFVLFVATRSHVHGWDPCAYAARAHDHPLLSERYLSTRLLHPHHLLYLPVARTFARVLPFSADPFLPLQILSALGAALAAMTAGWIVRGRGGSARRALVATLATGLAFGTWRYGGEAEVMTPALASLLLGVLALARAPGVRDAALAGLALAGATLLHETTMVFAAAALVVLAVELARRRIAGRVFAAFAVAWIVPVKLAYIAAAPRGAGIPGMIHWALGATDRAQHFASTAGWPSLVTLGAVGAFVPQQPLTDLRWFGPRHAAFVAGALLGLVVLAAAVGLLVRALPAIARAWRAADLTVRVLVTGALALAAAIGFFQPWNEEYWVYVPPLLVVIGARFVPAERGARRAAGVVLAGLLVLGVAYAWWPRRDAADAPYAETLAFAHARLAPGDLILGADDELGSALVALPLLAQVDALPPPAPEDAAGRARFDATIRTHLAAVAAGHGRVVATRGAWPDVERAAGSGWRLAPYGTLGVRPVATLVPR